MNWYEKATKELETMEVEDPKKYAALKALSDVMLRGLVVPKINLFKIGENYGK